MPRAVADVLQQLSMLPPFPKVTTKLLAMLQDDTVSMDDLAVVVSSDPSLATKVIHLSNSPFYMVARQVETVKDALFVLGVGSIKSITTGLSIQKGLNQLQPRSALFNMQDFWKHSYATAIVANKLGARRDRKLGDSLYLAGLIHDVGKMIMAYYWPEVWKGIVKTQAQTSEPVYDIEARLFHHTHAAIAAELFRNWKFPPAVIELVEYHHACEPVQGAPGVERSLLWTANVLVNAHGHGFPLARLKPPVVFDVDAYQDVTDTLDEELEYQLRMLTT
ncbi:MAG: HDOD domain-containing protein [Candidatus Zixiibacteriota bacterium]